MPTYSTYKPSGVSSLTAATGTSVNTSTGAVTIWFNGQVALAGTTSTFVIANTTTSFGTDTGALVVYGGAGIGGDLYVGNTAFVSGSEVVTTATISQYVPSQTVITAGTDTAVSSSTGALSIWNTSTLQSVTSRGSSTNVALLISNTTNADSTVTGALVVSGGVGIGQDLYVGGSAIINGALAITTATISQFTSSATNSFVAGTDTVISTSSGIVYIWNNSTLESVTSRGFTTTQRIIVTNTTGAFSTNTGAVVIAGGLGVGGSIYATEIYENGARVITTATAQAFGVSYINPGVDISVNTNTGVVTINNVSTLQSVTARGSTSSSIIQLTTSTNSFSTTTGALVVTGGVGIGGNLFVGGNTNLKNVTATNLVANLIDATDGFIDNLSVISMDSAGTVNATSMNAYTADFNLLEVTTATFVSTTTFLSPIVYQRTMLDTYITTVTNTATVQVAGFTVANYRSCKALIQVEDPGVNYQVVELVLLISHSGAIYMSEYGIINTGPQDSGTFTADFLSPNVRLFFTAATTSTKTITVAKTSMPRSDFSGVN